MLWASLVSLVGLLHLRWAAAFLSAVRPSPQARRAPTVTRAAADGGDCDHGGHAGPGSRRAFLAGTLAAGTAAGLLPPQIGAARATEDEPGVAARGNVDPSAATRGSIDPSTALPTITDKVFLEVQLANDEPRRLVIGLFGQAMPQVTENFRTLCTNSEGPSYKGSSFYRGETGRDTLS